MERKTVLTLAFLFFAISGIGMVGANDIGITAAATWDSGTADNDGGPDTSTSSDSTDTTDITDSWDSGTADNNDGSTSTDSDSTSDSDTTDSTTDSTDSDSTDTWDSGTADNNDGSTSTEDNSATWDNQTADNNDDTWDNETATNNDDGTSTNSTEWDNETATNNDDTWDNQTATNNDDGTNTTQNTTEDTETQDTDTSTSDSDSQKDDSQTGDGPDDSSDDGAGETGQDDSQNNETDTGTDDESDDGIASRIRNTITGFFQQQAQDRLTARLSENTITLGESVTVTGNLETADEGTKQVVVLVENTIFSTTSTDSSGKFETTIFPDSAGQKTVTVRSGGAEQNLDLEVLSSTDTTVEITRITTSSNIEEGERIEVCPFIRSDVEAQVELFHNGNFVAEKTGTEQVCFNVILTERENTFRAVATVPGDRDERAIVRTTSPTFISEDSGETTAPTGQFALSSGPARILISTAMGLLLTLYILYRERIRI